MIYHHFMLLGFTESLFCEFHLSLLWFWLMYWESYFHWISFTACHGESPRRLFLSFSFVFSLTRRISLMRKAFRCARINRFPFHSRTPSSGIEGNPTVFYRLMPGSTAQTNKYHTFYLQQRQDNGDTWADIKVNHPLDYETIKEYNLTIRVEVSWTGRCLAWVSGELMMNGVLWRKSFRSAGIFSIKKNSSIWTSYIVPPNVNCMSIAERVPENFRITSPNI